MPGKLITIRDQVVTWLAGIDGTGSWNTDISGAGQRVKGFIPFLKVQLFPAVMVTWGREEGERAELARLERRLFLNVILVEKRADMRASDDSLADLAADLKNRLEVPDIGGTEKWLGLVGVDVKGVTVDDVDPIEVSPEESENGIVAWAVTVLIKYRHDRGGA